MSGLAGRVALVTGAASGIGAATAERLARKDVIVVCADTDEAGAAHTAAILPGARGLRLDVTDPGAWAKAAQALVSEFGGWHILINAAGITGGGPDATLADAPLETWRRVFAVNVEGVLLGCQTAIRHMSEGAIVNVASTVAVTPTPTLAAYGASKAAVVQLTRTVAAWCARQTLPIRCNALMPGMADTPMVGGMTDAYRAQWEAQIPARRFASPAEIAAAIVFLASDDASYINGAALPVDGGLLSRAVI